MKSLNTLSLELDYYYRYTQELFAQLCKLTPNCKYLRSITIFGGIEEDHLYVELVDMMIK
jgi:hypothetical protein